MITTFLTSLLEKQNACYLNKRIFLQVATEALAEGRSIDKVKGAKIGVFIGAPEQTGYAELNHPNEPVSVAGLMPGMIATRVAYQWDLKGPTMLIDTACSSSLMAMKCACDSIRNKECEGAIVGGVNLKIIFSPSKFRSSWSERRYFV